ncbi:MAG: cell division protein ZapE [Pseudomonadota bacterium]
MSTPLERYQSLLDSGEYRQDSEQFKVVEALDDLYHRLLDQPRQRWWRRGPSAPVEGLYLWGGVGRGKTWLMDLFYGSLPFDQKLRVHFHRFMARIHAELRQRSQEADPIPDIARGWANQFRVLCFDEFYVSDIADAMLLAGILEALFERGITLVATSNIPPQDLYKGGLQRARFLPAIDLIERHTKVLPVGGDTDFRLRLLQRSELYAFPNDETAEQLLTDCFERISADCDLSRVLRVNERDLLARRRGDSVVWFEFSELCERPRSTLDYIEIAKAFNTVLLSNVSVLTEDTSDAARRFINLVDEFYDRNVKLIISAEAPIDGLYRGNRLAFEFDRTRSRLTEMQSVDYLARPHLP